LDKLPPGTSSISNVMVAGVAAPAARARARAASTAARRAVNSGLLVNTRRRNRTAGVESIGASTCASQREVGESHTNADSPRSQAILTMM
jgi:hypothetical protein